MQYTAFIWNEHTVSWSGIVIALAALSAILMVMALRAAQGRPVWHVTLLALIGTVLGVYLARFIHWYCNSAQYASFGAAMSDLSSGGFAVTGVFFAVLIAAALLRLLRVYDDLAAVLDCAAPAGALGLAVGRMANLLSTADRSKFMLEGEAFHRLPWTVLSTTASGGEEWRIATFALESLSCAVIFLFLLVVFFVFRKKPRAVAKWRDGNVFLLFLALYGAFTVVLDSTRYDAGYLRSNGFVSLTQICCVAGLLFALGIYIYRAIRGGGFRKWYIAVFVLAAVCAGLGGYMEYFVQRRGHLFILAYSIMESCFFLLFLITLLFFSRTGCSAAEEKSGLSARSETRGAAPDGGNGSAGDAQPELDEQGGYYDADGWYYDNKGGCCDPDGGYYAPDGSYYDPDGHYYPPRGDDALPGEENQTE